MIGNNMIVIKETKYNSAPQNQNDRMYESDNLD